MRTSAFSSISSALATNEYLGPRRFSRYSMAASGNITFSTMVRRFALISVDPLVTFLQLRMRRRTSSRGNLSAPPRFRVGKFTQDERLGRLSHHQGPAGSLARNRDA